MFDNIKVLQRAKVNNYDENIQYTDFRKSSSYLKPSKRHGVLFNVGEVALFF